MLIDEGHLVGDEMNGLGDLIAHGLPLVALGDEVVEAVDPVVGAHLLGGERFGGSYDGFVHGSERGQRRLPVELRCVEDPESKFASTVFVGCALGDHRTLPRLAISMATRAASAPLLPILVPARSMACSMESAVMTPKAIGTPVATETCEMPLVASPAT